MAEPTRPNGGIDQAELWADDEPVDLPMIFGPWQFAVRGAEIADVHFRGRPVLRSIRFIVRDHDWRTAENTAAAISQADDRLTMAARSSFDGLPVVEWTATLSGRASTVRYAVEARVVAPFRRNRIGLVVLHGPDLAGTPVEVVHPEGTAQRAYFPEQIAAHQPAMEVAGYRWQHVGVDCRLELAGEVFEMEDQRNWTDASYKTYSTPLSEPFPVPVHEGDCISHALELTCTTDPGQPWPPGSTPPSPPPPPPMITPLAAQLPVLQLGASTAPDASAAPPIVEELPVLVEVPADEPCWPAVLERAGTDSSSGLDVRLIASGPEQIAPVINALKDSALADRLCRVGVYGRAGHLAEPRLLAELQTVLDRLELEVEVVAGTRAHFTELNRKISSFDGWPGALSCSLTPQMHDRSRAQVIESVGPQRLVARQAVRLAGGRPVHLGPVTLRPRFNAVATTPFVPSTAETLVGGYGAEHVTDATDPRQHATAIAAWTVAVIAALAVPGIASITLFESWGPRGIRRSPGDPYGPTGQVIDWVCRGGQLITPEVEILAPDGATIACIAQRTGTTRQLVIGNLDARDVTVRVDMAPAEICSIGNQTVIMDAPDGGAGKMALRVPAFSAARLR